MTATSTNLGRVAMVPKGTWDSETAYTKLDVVVYSGSSYVAKQNVPAGTVVTNTTYWQLIAEKGTTGGIGQMADQFNPISSYAVGDYCTYDESLYRFITAHPVPAWNVSEVTLLTANAFDSSASYAIGDYCSYNGAFYQFTSAHSGAWDNGDVTEIDAEEFSATGTYAVGDYCTRENLLYIFTTAHYNGAWDSSWVTLVTVAYELQNRVTVDDLNSAMEDKADADDLADYLPLVGGDLTGTLTNTGDYKINTTVNPANPPVSEYNWTNGYYIVDVNGKVVGGIRSVQTTANQYSIRLGVERTVDSTDYDNTVVLRLANDGSKSVALDVPAWNKAMFPTSNATTPLTHLVGFSDGRNGGYAAIPLPKALGGTGNTSGTADALTNSRTFRVNLASTSTASFDGTSNATPGVNGTLGTGNGGTGRTDGKAVGLATARALRTNLSAVYDSNNPVTFDGTSGAILPVSGKVGIGNGGTNSTTWDGALSALGALSGYCGDLATADSELATVFRCRTTSTVNPSLYTALGSSYAYVIQIYYNTTPSDRTATSARIQIAFPYGKATKKMAFRSYYENAWGDWHVVTGS